MENRSARPFPGSSIKLAAAMALLLAAGVARAQSVLLETWTGISGNAVTNLTSSASYPASPNTRTNPTVFEIANNSADNYGTRIRGFVTPPTTGNYTFWIACDDACELWFNATGDNASGATRIAYTTLWTNSREWTKYSTQTSAAISLTGGQRYYIETRHKEATGGDGLAVGWQGPGITGEAERPIPGSRLQPFIHNITVPTITTQPANRTVNLRQTAAFSVVASGTGLSYQWRRNGVNVTSGTGGTTANYTTDSTVAGDNGAVYSVVVRNGAGSVTSSNATLTVNSPPAITTQPASQTVTAPNQASFSVVATGTAPLSYQWRENGTNIPNATTATHSFATTTAMSGRQYSVAVTNSAGSVISSNATLTVNSTPVAPSITTQPVSQTVTDGNPVTFTVVATGTAPLTYQWRENGANIPNATSATLSFTATTALNGRQYSVVVSNSAGSTPSANATLTVNSTPVAPSITTQPVSQTVVAGNPATFTVVATGTAPLTYQWRENGANIPNATSATLSFTATTALNGRQYSVVVSNSAGSTPSANATLTVTSGGGQPVLAPQATPVNAVLNGPVTFTVTVTGGTSPFTYQWRRNGSNISGATSASYTIPTTALADNGVLFTCAVTNSAGTTISTGSTLNIELVTSRVTATRVTATELVTTPLWEIPDYVFEKGYALRTLPELEQYLATHKHLPEVPSAADIKARGMNMGEMNVKLLKNLEELTLHMISLQKEMKAKDSRLERQLDSLRTLLKTR